MSPNPFNPWQHLSNCAKFWDVALTCGPPEWTTPNAIIYEDPAVLLRQFRDGRENPILILPPQAGHSSHIADYGPDQSLVQTCLNSTDNPVYCVEWKSCTYERRDETIDDLVRQTDRCVNRIIVPYRKIGGSIHLISLCQAGWLSAIYTSLYPHKVKSLTLAAAPTDFTAGGGIVQLMAQGYPMSFYRWLVSIGGGLMRGEFMLMGWKMTNPTARFFLDYYSLWVDALVGDDKALARSKKFRSWWEYPMNLAGNWYLRAVRELFKENRLIKGDFKVLGQYVDLKNITCPVTLIAGEKDNITPVPQLFNMAHHISTPQDKIIKRVIPGAGHVGTFMGGKGLKTVWAPILKSICQPPHEADKGAGAVKSSGGSALAGWKMVGR